MSQLARPAILLLMVASLTAGGCTPRVGGYGTGTSTSATTSSGTTTPAGTTTAWTTTPIRMRTPIGTTTPAGRTTRVFTRRPTADTTAPIVVPRRLNRETIRRGRFEKQATRAAEPPCKKKDEPVLYGSGYAKDNSSCLTCHADFKRELLCSVHLKAKITCAACHGDSEAHRGDEFNIIPPDVLWGRAEMAAFCKQCHKRHEHPEAVRKFRLKWQDKRRPNGRLVQTDSVCTDCHGNHAVVVGEGNFR